jgi:hypothetical protein
MSTTREASDVLDGQATFSREELVDLSFLRIIAEVNTIRKELKEHDFDRLLSLGGFLEAANRLIVDLGFGDGPDA